MSDPATEELAGYRRELEANHQAAVELCRTLSAEQINWRPGPGRWSVAECLQHLGVSAQEYETRILAAARTARARALFSSAPSRFSWLTRRVIQEMEPPPRSRQRSPRRFRPPAESLEPTEILARVEATARTWDQCLTESADLDLVRVKVRSPAVPLLRFRLGALFAIIAAHERRHLWQAREVCGSPGFPGVESDEVAPAAR
jgi:hypothetical protein